MSIPDFQSVMLPLLKFLGDHQEHSLRETLDNLAIQFDLSENERRELLPSGKKAVFYDRVGWARTYLKKAGLLENTKRGYFRITKRGLTILDQNLLKIDVRFLCQIEEFLKFYKPNGKKNERHEK
ncbi:restriction endonuclease [Desulfonema ishimotonii]|uniref:Restriction endonuclease n=1 Tax=Desulfonema ishimotonii TaxID=45657 RepID=A0A401FQ94_9BACT|nr:winged helix-turn-helix domain-containing protein [Desulfonema ishimotonii]GBC59159.1 restriction endonuclease [Desulfonema ishimotonii]